MPSISSTDRRWKLFRVSGLKYACTLQHLLVFEECGELSRGSLSSTFYLLRSPFLTTLFSGSRLSDQNLLVLQKWSKRNCYTNGTISKIPQPVELSLLLRLRRYEQYGILQRLRRSIRFCQMQCSVKELATGNLSYLKVRNCKTL